MEHAKKGAGDGPWEAVVKQVSIIDLYAEGRKCQIGGKFIVPPTCQIHHSIRISYNDLRRNFTSTRIKH